jgi:hypothetical protein
MPLQRINWTQIDSANVPSGSTVYIGSMTTPVDGVYTNRYYCYPGDDRVYRILSTSTTWVLQTNISSGLARTTCGVAAADCI